MCPRNNLHKKNTCYSVNGMAFRVFRKQLGWTQVELSQRSGYSDRVIRKAETGGKLRPQTIQELAAAMSVEGQIVTFADLTIDLESIARRFIEGFDLLCSGILNSCCDIFADDFVLNCPADPNQFSFAGVWIGKSGFQEFVNRFFGTFTRRSGILKPVYMVCEDHVVARLDDQVSYQGNELPAYWVNFHFEFSHGLIIRIDYEFDSVRVSKSLEKFRKQNAG